jgi:cell division protein FtsZ
VVGTVIDPEMGDELKVTVVATGLGGIARPNVVVDNAPVRASDNGEIDYQKLDRPTIMRQQAARHQQRSVDTSEARDLDYLDIPAFLRRQAD